MVLAGHRRAVPLWQLWLLAWVLLWSWVNPGETRFMEIRLAELRQKKSRCPAQAAVGAL
jgi:monofunctional biosynthetic peptidoglycan transglycosylase